VILTGVVWSEDFKEQLRKYAVLFNQREARALVDLTSNGSHF
jgi:hypothetical protein